MLLFYTLNKNDVESLNKDVKGLMAREDFSLQMGDFMYKVNSVVLIMRSLWINL